MATLIAPPGHDSLLHRAFALGAQRVLQLSAAPGMGTDRLRAPAAGTAAAGTARADPDRARGLGRRSRRYQAMLAALLDCSFANAASGLQLGDDEAVACCETADGDEDIALTLPAVVSAELALATPRYDDVDGLTPP